MIKNKILASLAIVALLLALPASVLAQAQPPRPPVFGGNATLDGATAANGTAVTAWIEGAQVASTTVTGGNYAFVIAQPPGESYQGKTITFMVGAGTASQTGTWEADGGSELNLTAQTGPPPPTATPVPPPTPVVGLTGPKGDRGAPGAGGAAGAAGVPGPAGSAGPAGPAGSAGAKGDSGAAGATGDAGAAGSAGAQGNTGSAGPAGPAGTAGSAGSAGGGILGIIALIIAIVALVGAGGAFMAGRRA